MKLSLGCGEVNFGKNWVHIDQEPYDHAKQMPVYPLQYKGVELIYASHILDYYDYEEVPKVLSNWCEALKKGGILRLAVPDFRAMTALYQEGRVTLNQWGGEDKPIQFPLSGKLGEKDPIYHKSWWDETALGTALIDAGFSVVRPWDWRKIAVHKKHKDCSRSERCGMSISLNLEGCKK
jgi:predicted SAM-dependent methyltransferase